MSMHKRSHLYCNEILACPREDGWGSKTVAQSHTIVTSPVATRVKISELEEEAALLIILQSKIHCSYIDHTVNTNTTGFTKGSYQCQKCTLDDM